jgi:hypothetical protein
MESTHASALCHIAALFVYVHFTAHGMLSIAPLPVGMIIRMGSLS